MAAGGRERHGNRGGEGRDDGASLNIEDRRDNLPPIQQRLRIRYEKGEQALSAAAAPRQSYALPPDGSFVPPADQSWATQADMIKDPRNNVGFDTSRLFDGIVAAKSGLRGLYDPRRRDYAKYEGLRTNLAVLRNTLLASGMKPQQMKSIAVALGQAFANDNWWKRPLTNWLSADVASVEGVGAGEMYKYLLEVQHTPAPLQGARVAINSRFGFADRNWGLPPLGATPFSPNNLAAPLAADESTPSPASQPNFAERYLASRNVAGHFKA